MRSKYTLSYNNDSGYVEKWSCLRAIWELKIKDLLMEEIGGLREGSSDKSQISGLDSWMDVSLA